MDYTTISRPYDSITNRTPGGTSPVLNELSTLFNQPAQASSATDPTSTGTAVSSMGTGASYTGTTTMMTAMGPVETQPVASGASMSNVSITTYIQSSNYKMGAVGFNIDGSSGSAEFNNVTVRGTIYATVGQIGGWTVNGAILTGGNVASGTYVEMDGSIGAFISYVAGVPRAEIVADGLLFFDVTGNPAASISATGPGLIISADGAGPIEIDGDLTISDLIIPLSDLSSDIGETNFRFDAAYINQVFCEIVGSDFRNTGDIGYMVGGTGSPQGVVNAYVGTIWLRTDGGTNTTLYVKESGVGTNTGWVAK